MQGQTARCMQSASGPTLSNSALDRAEQLESFNFSLHDKILDWSKLKKKKKKKMRKTKKKLTEKLMFNLKMKENFVGNRRKCCFTSIFSFFQHSFRKTSNWGSIKLENVW